MKYITDFFKLIFDGFKAFGRFFIVIFTSIAKIIGWFASNLTTLLLFIVLGAVLWFLYSLSNKIAPSGGS
jgi:hypothetical protein